MLLINVKNWKMFGHRKANKLIEDIDRYFDLMDQALLVFKSGVRNYLYSNKDEFNENLMRMSATDSEAGVLRREIENALYTQTAVSRVLRTSTTSRLSSV